MSKITKIDKTVDAHEGNVTVGKWSPDGSTLLTGQYNNLKYLMYYYDSLIKLAYLYKLGKLHMNQIKTNLAEASQNYYDRQNQIV